MASLNHPNIAAIYGLDEADGVRFLVLELIAGETLADRLARGPLPIRQALEICRQIAEALEAAHERGVIHRDLKPANVKVTPDGKVKVLDFGLAKALATEPAERELSQSPTISSSGTHAGVILGTAPYMSPEQARGQPLDKRTDVWSFGCLLYETTTGRRAFHGVTVSDTIAAVLDREADWTALPAATPAIVRSLLRRCLQKERSRRLHDVGDARLEIEEALSGEIHSGPVAVGARPARARFRSSWAATVVALIAAAGAVSLDRLGLLPMGGTAAVPRLDRVARLTHDPGLSEWPTWSPDGSLLAFASNRSGNFEIYVRRVRGGQQAVNITNDPGEDFQPAFSPDGNWVAFVSTRSSRTGLIKIGAIFGFEFRTLGGDLWLAPALGGRAHRLARDANFPAWHPGGGRVAYVSGPEFHRSILEVDTQGGKPRDVLAVESSTWEIIRLQYVPNSEWISFEATDEKVRLVPAAGGPVRDLVAGSNHAWDATGSRIFFLTRDPGGGTRLQSAAVDLGRDKALGRHETVGVFTGILRDVAISRDGRQLAVSELEGSLNLTRIRLAEGGGAIEGNEEELSSGQVIDRYPAFSRDGKRIAYVSDRLGPQEIWILDLESRRAEPLRMPGEGIRDSSPQWSPDGRQVAAGRLSPDGSRALWLAASDGSHAEPLGPTGPDLQIGQFSPDGTKVLYGSKVAAVQQIFALDLATRRSQQLTSTPGDKYLDPAVWSPDGEWIAYASTIGGAMQLWRVSAAGGEAQQMTTGDERMRHPAFSPDGRWIYIQPSHRNIYRVPAAGGRLEQVTRFPESGLFLEEPTVSPDGRWLAYCRSNGGSSLWLMTLEGAH